MINCPELREPYKRARILAVLWGAVNLHIPKNLMYFVLLEQWVF